MWCFIFIFCLSHHISGCCMGFRGGKRFDIKYLIEKLLHEIERIDSFNFQWEDLKEKVWGILILILGKLLWSERALA